MGTTQDNPAVELVAFCGLYCGACGARKKRGCPGCRDNAKASWCKVRSCCMQNKYDSCADCVTHSDPAQCRKFNNIISRIFGLIFRSDRCACIERMRAVGREAYAQEMAAKGEHAIRRQKGCGH